MMELGKMATVALPSSTTTLPLSISAAALRHFQLLFALGSHMLFDRVFNHVRTTLDVDHGIRVAVSIMVSCSTIAAEHPLKTQELTVRPLQNLITLVYAAVAISAVYVSHKLSNPKRYGI